MRHDDVGAFQLYDIDGDGTITYSEMLQIVQSIYKMTGQMVKLPPDEDTPEKVRIFILYPWNADEQLSSGWTRSSRTWTETRMLSLHMMSLSKGASRILQSCRYVASRYYDPFMLSPWQSAGTITI